MGFINKRDTKAVTKHLTEIYLGLQCCLRKPCIPVIGSLGMNGIAGDSFSCLEETKLHEQLFPQI